MTQPAVIVSPNVPGDIIVGENILKINNNYGTVVYRQAPARVKPRGVVPQPPRKPRDFVGRATELARLEINIAANEAVWVYGPDGLGKTALLKQAANGIAAHGLPQGVIVLESQLANGQATGFEDLVQQLFDALYESEPSLKVTATTARTYLSNNRPLILVDNLPLTAANVATLADLVPQGAILFASTNTPPGEASTPLKLGPMTREDSVRLLAARLELDVDAGNRPQLEAICASLGDVPLALVTVANTVRDRQLHLPQTLETLNNLASAEPLARAYDFARLNLTSAERSLVAIAANSPAVSVDPDWLRTAANDPPQFDSTLYDLQRRELLVANSPRLRVAPGLRTLAQLNQADRDDLMQRLSQYLLERLLIHETDFDYVGDELGNILGAIDWAVRRGLWTMALNLGRAVDPFLTLRGKWETWAYVLEHCLTAARGKGDRAAEAWALHQLGTRALGLNATQTALDLLNQALTLRQRLGDTVGAAYTQHNLNLILPPGPPPRGNQTPPKGPRPNTPNLPLLVLAGVGGLGVLALLGLIGLAVLFGLGKPTSTPISGLVPTTQVVTVARATLTDTFTPTVTETVTPTDTATPTATATPAPLIFQVTTTDDLPDTQPGDGKCEYKPGLCSLRAAIMEANQQAAPVEIDVPAGSYTINTSTANEDESAVGDLDVRRTVIVKGAGADTTFIVGRGQDGADRLMQVLPGANLRLEGLTLDGGSTPLSGGGLQIDKGATAEIVDSAFTGNTAARGGGISNEGQLKLEASVMFGNVAGQCGGGLFNAGQAALTNVTLFQNTATPLTAGVEGQNTFGGGICNEGDLRLESVSLADNASKGSGGNLFNNDQAQGTVSVHNTLVVNGTCVGTINSLGFNLAGAGSGACLKLFRAKGDSATEQQVTNFALSNNGGHILSLALIAESPAIDAGDPDNCPSVDGRELPRASGRCDVGAYEAP